MIVEIQGLIPRQSLTHLPRLGLAVTHSQTHTHNGRIITGNEVRMGWLELMIAFMIIIILIRTSWFHDYRQLTGWIQY